MTLKFDRWPRKTNWHFFILRQALCIIANPLMFSSLSYSPETLNSGRNWLYFVPCDLEIWWMTLENNRAPLLYYITLCALFQIHRWSQTWLTVLKRTIEIWWTILKNTRAPLLKYIKLCALFQSHSNWSYSLETLNSGQNRQFIVPCDLEIWWMAFKNYRAVLCPPVLCYFKLCASFHNHWWI